MLWCCCGCIVVCVWGGVWCVCINFCVICIGIVYMCSVAFECVWGA